jgi:ribonuclease HII
LIDGNRFRGTDDIPYQCIVKGDGIYMSIAAASILAKTHRDEYMCRFAEKYPQYGWETNKGYPTEYHRKAIVHHGITPLHRISYSMQLSLW